MLIYLKDIIKTFANQTIFEEISFKVEKNEKVGLVGINGSGKSTLLNIICGLDKDFTGKYQKNCSINYLSQEQNLSSESTLFEECRKVFSEILAIEKQLTELQHEAGNANLEKIGKLQTEFEALGGYEIDISIKKVLYGLSFTEETFERKIKTFSGGEKRRIMLAKVLLSPADLLILDEPTNHLDIFSVKWLEDFLVSYEGAILLVSHDKYFLNNIVKGIFEIENHKIKKFTGNYDEYLIQKEEEKTRNTKLYKQQQSFLEKEKEFINKNLAGQKTKQAKSRRKRLEKLDLLDKPSFVNKEININFSGLKKSYTDVLHIENFSLKIDNLHILNDISLYIRRLEKVCIIGLNGSGKTTLLNAIIKDENEKIKIGQNVIISYFKQELDNLNTDQTLFETIHNKSPLLTEFEIRNLLSRFHFYETDIDKTVDVLSGGEKSRFAMLLFVLEEANFLVLDEPTNHLDITTIDSLAQIMKDFSGTVLYVSHDRNFIDKTADKILLLHNGKITTFIGNFSDNEEKILNHINPVKSNSEKKKSDDAKKKSTHPKPAKKNVNIYKANKIEEKIQELEEEKQKYIEYLEKPELVNNYGEYTVYTDKINEIDNEIEQKIKEWENYFN